MSATVASADPCYPRGLHLVRHRGAQALGVVKPGRAAFVADGNIRLGGASGQPARHACRGHVSRVNHVIEAVRQLRRTVEPARQVPDCADVVVVNEGNFFEGAVLVLEKGEL
jgi:hypothetical protein